MDNINIKDLKKEELDALISEISSQKNELKKQAEPFLKKISELNEEQQKLKEEIDKLNNLKSPILKKIFELDIKQSQLKEEWKMQLKDNFTKDSSIILKELINKYEQLLNIDINSLPEEEKLKLYVQKAYIENLMIGGDEAHSYKKNVGLSSYDGDINSFLENGMNNLYDDLYFSVKKHLNERLINICMKKIARLKGKSDDFIMKISNFSSSSLIYLSYYNSQDLLYLIDNIDNFFEKDSVIPIDPEERNHIPHDNNYPLSNISIGNKKMINQYLCNKLKFNGSISDKYEFLINSMARLHSIQHNSTIDESLRIVKKWIDSLTSIDYLKRKLNESDNFEEKLEYSINNVADATIGVPDFYNIKEECALLNENSIPVFMTEEEEENFKKAFNIGEIGSK